MPALLASSLFRWPCSISFHLSPTYVSQVRCLHCWGPPFPLAMQLFSKEVTVRGSQCFLRVSTLLRDSVSAFPPACHPLSSFSLVIASGLSPFCLPLSPVLPPFLLVTVSALSPCFPLSPLFVCLLVGHCVHLVSLLSPLVALVSRLVSLLVGHCLPSVSFCFPSCLPRIATQQSRAGRQMERIARQRLAPRNKKGDKRKQKGDKPT